MMVLPAVDAVLQPAGFKPFLRNARKLVPRVQYVPSRKAAGSVTLKAQTSLQKSTTAAELLAQTFNL